MKKGLKRIFGLFVGFAVCLIPLEAFAAEEEETLGQKMTFAAQNTVIGIVTVFCMLLLMALVIYCLRFLPKLAGAFGGNKGSGQKHDQQQDREQQWEQMEAAAPPPDYVQQAAPLEEEQTEDAPQSDDEELIAVITAAIAAARVRETTVPAGSFVVRTIKKRA